MDHSHGVFEIISHLWQVYGKIILPQISLDIHRQIGLHHSADISNTRYSYIGQYMIMLFWKDNVLFTENLLLLFKCNYDSEESELTQKYSRLWDISVPLPMGPDKWILRDIFADWANKQLTFQSFEITTLYHPQPNSAIQQHIDRWVPAICLMLLWHFQFSA